MSTVRKKLLRWVPVLGSVHRLLHSAKNALNRRVTRIKEVIDHIRFNIVWEARIQRLARHSKQTPKKKPIIHLYAICRNEEQIIPYFMSHYQPFVDEFNIYDNRSSDSSLERLARYDNVTIIPFDTGDTFDEAAHMQIKNNAWKKSRGKADFVIVCDMDEFLYHPEMASFLYLLKQHSFTVVRPHGYDMVSEQLPEFDGVHPITQLIKTGFDSWRNYSKTVLFSPTLEEINFSPGSHRASPQGRVKLFRSDHLKLLHYKYVDRNKIIQKTQTCRARLSETNKKHGWGRHYEKSDAQVMREFDSMLSIRRTII